MVSTIEIKNHQINGVKHSFQSRKKRSIPDDFPISKGNAWCFFEINMANTYTQLHVQFIFAAKKRQALISEKWQNELHKYITGIVQDNKHKMLQINSMPDHLHFLAGLRPHQSCSDLIKLVKGGSSAWINSRGLCEIPFYWQTGFGAFSYSNDQVANVISYIQNQQQHHLRENFLDEYRRLLVEFEIEFDEQYIFRPLE